MAYLGEVDGVETGQITYRSWPPRSVAAADTDSWHIPRPSNLDRRDCQSATHTTP
jgi:hypothetical protein